MGSKDEKVMGLFLAAVLTFTPGCMFGDNTHTHIDRNRDGYCDVDGQSMTSSSNSSGTRYFGSHSGSTASTADTSSGHMSSASTPKGGIGSHSIGGGG